MKKKLSKFIREGLRDKLLDHRFAIPPQQLNEMLELTNVVR